MALGLLPLIGVGATLFSLKESADARSDQRQAQRVQQRIQERKMRMERLRAIREARIQQGLLGVQAANTGTQNTSAVQGASANIQQQLGTNLAFVNQIQGMQQAVQSNMESASRHQQNASALAGVASLTSNLGGLFE